MSPSYAEEIQTPEFGMGLDGVLRRHAGKLRGILNGLDTEVFDPGKDPYLPAPYTREDPSGKARAKEAFRERTGLRPPVLAYVGRLDYQKGLDLVLKPSPASWRWAFASTSRAWGTGGFRRRSSGRRRKTPKGYASSPPTTRPWPAWPTPGRRRSWSRAALSPAAWCR